MQFCRFNFPYHSFMNCKVRKNKYHLQNTPILQNVWKSCHRRIRNVKTVLRGHETADGRGTRVLLIEPRPWLLGAGNGPVPGGGAAQQCRWSRAQPIVPMQGHATGRPAIPYLAPKVLRPGKLLSLERTEKVGHPIEVLSKTRIMRECWSYGGFLVLLGLPRIINRPASHFEQ